MNNRLIPWSMTAAGGFLIWSAIANKNPLLLVKAVLQGKTPADVPDWGTKNEEPGIFGAPLPPGTGGNPPAPGTTPPSATTPPARPITGSDPQAPQVF